MDNLPFDISHPGVRNYLWLVRLQVLTPLSLLINIATVCICAVVTKPTISKVIENNVAAFSPSPPVLGAYVAVLFLGQIGYCVLLIMASKRETMYTLIKGVGMSLVTANFVMALCAVCWVMQWFLVASILQGVMLLVLAYSVIALDIYHPATSERPLDAAFIHSPIRFFLVLTMSLIFPYSLFVALNLTGTEHWHAWTALGIVIGTNLFSLIMEVFQRDVVWCIATTWVCVSMWIQRPKPVQIYATTIAFTAIHPIALLSAIAYVCYARRSERPGPVSLPRDDEHPGLYGGTQGGDPSAEDPAQERLVRTTRHYAQGQKENDPTPVWG
ncbi:hypothetical protein AX14_011338 [Amanita brunnescens Koide BX004]|nr:hypothetical protein AX14_011338 [Amanita brunnescens Koide BX004]